MIRLQARNLSKAYPVYRRPIDSLKEAIFRKPHHDTVWAVRDVNLAVRAGSAVGIVGDNGAGKTTLLKMLAGSTEPTSGKIESGGRLSAILDLGAGFHRELSGMENIRIGCAVLGLSPAQTAEHVPSIVDFSELGGVLDRPVHTYSSGMFLRLAFSVATSVNPDILIVDEHLSVGDQHFRKKCIDRIGRLLAGGAGLVFCSHDFYSVREVCAEALWMRDGRPAMFGRTQEVLEAYQDFTRAKEGATASDTSQPAADGFAEKPAFGGETRILSYELCGLNDGTIESGRDLKLAVRAKIAREALAEGVHVGVLITRNDQQWCYGLSTKTDGIKPNSLTPLGGGEFGVRLTFPELPLLAGQYSMTLGLLDADSPHVYDLVNSALEFKVNQNTGEFGMVRLPHTWDPY